MPKNQESDPWFDEPEQMWFKIVVELERPRLFMKAQSAEHWVQALSFMNPWEIAARAIFSLQSGVNFFEVSLDHADKEMDAAAEVFSEDKLAGL